MKSWVKGGLILGSIFLIISVICLIEVQINYGKGDMGTFGYWVILLLSGLLFIPNLYEWLYKIFPSNKEVLSLLIVILLTTIIYFLIGAVIGLIIGKIKKNKKNKK